MGRLGYVVNIAGWLITGNTLMVTNRQSFINVVRLYDYGFNGACLLVASVTNKPEKWKN